jgi:hypothetical protein
MDKAGPNQPDQVIDFGIKKKRRYVNRRKKQYTCPFGDNFVIPSVCQEFHNKNRFNCSSITLEDVLAIRRKIYATLDKISQDKFISNFVEGYEPKRRRPRKSPNNSISFTHCISLLYTLEKKDGTKINVCKAMFIAVTGFSKERIVNVAKQISKHGVISENRGGDRRSTVFVDKKIIQLVRETDQKIVKDKESQEFSQEDCVPLAQLAKGQIKSRKRRNQEDFEVLPEQDLIEFVDPKTEFLRMELSELCRICLQNESGLVYLFENVTEDQTYADLVTFCLPLKVT